MQRKFHLKLALHFFQPLKHKVKLETDFLIKFQIHRNSKFQLFNAIVEIIIIIAQTSYSIF
jgi:hypothetical protein